MQIYSTNINTYFTQYFKKTMETYVTMLGYIQRTTKEFQRKGITLSRAQFFLLDDLIDWVAEGRAMSGSNHWARRCQLGSYYNSKDGTKLVAKHFHNGVIKLQKNQAGQLTCQEKAAVASLRKENKEISADAALCVVDADREEMIDPFDAPVAKRMKGEAEEELGDYFDCRFILGSAAEVVSNLPHFSTSPYLLEVILFLKFSTTNTGISVR
jgi:hypothetical protein